MTASILALEEQMSRHGKFKSSSLPPTDVDGILADHKKGLDAKDPHRYWHGEYEAPTSSTPKPPTVPGHVPNRMSARQRKAAKALGAANAKKQPRRKGAQN